MKHRLLRLLCYQDKLRLNWEVVLMRDPMANILKPIVKQPVAARHVVLHGTFNQEKKTDGLFATLVCGRPLQICRINRSLIQWFVQDRDQASDSGHKSSISALLLDVELT